jgi:regulator of replication initiation timing
MSLENKLSELTRQVQTLKSENGTLKSANGTLKSENDTLKSALAGVEKNRDSIQREKLLFQNKCSDLTTKISTLKAQVNQAVCKKCTQRCF